MSESTSAYGDYPAMPGEPPYAPSAAEPAPSSVLLATKLMLARAAVTVLGLVVLVLTRDSLREQIARQQPGLSATARSAAVTLGVTVGVVFGLVFVVLYVLLARQVRRGKSWARIVTLVLAALALLGALASIFQPAPVLNRLVSLVSAVLDVGILFLLAQPRSGEFFRRAP